MGAGPGTLGKENERSEVGVESSIGSPGSIAVLELDWCCIC